MSGGWIGVDLDGTLAHYEGHVDGIGKPVPRMLARVRAWLAAGQEVRIFTARVSKPERPGVRAEIQEWCVAHLGRILPITNEKDYSMVRLYDDSAIQVEKNTGRLVGQD